MLPTLRALTDLINNREHRLYMSQNEVVVLNNELVLEFLIRNNVFVKLDCFSGCWVITFSISILKTMNIVMSFRLLRKLNCWIN